MSNSEEIRAYIVKNDQVLEVEVTPHKDPMLCYVRPIGENGLPYGQRDMRLLSGVLSTKDAALGNLHNKLLDDRRKLMGQIYAITDQMEALVAQMTPAARKRHTKISEDEA